jgi:hypothetical protein
MHDFIIFVAQNQWLIAVTIALGCIIGGRIWSDKLNWGEITEPRLIIKKNKIYKVINVYTGKGWTEDWSVESIICLKIYNGHFLFNNSKDIYVSGDLIRFDDEEPEVGKIYRAVFPKSAFGRIVMTPVKFPK